MAKPKPPAQLRVALSTAKLTDQAKVDLATTVATAVPSSTLYTQHPPVHTAADAMIASGTALNTAAVAKRDLEKKIEIADETLNLARTQYSKATSLFRSAVETNATTLEDVASVGLTGRFGRATPAPLGPPTGVAIHLGKKHGQFRASAVYSGRAKYAAQVSTDPIGPATWLDLAGTGKERTVTGHPSGSLVWVRFRTLTKNAESDWCTPVSVTVP